MYTEVIEITHSRPYMEKYKDHNKDQISYISHIEKEVM